MGRSPCCDEAGLKKGPWTPEEDRMLTDFIQKNGHGSWRALPKLAGLNRCGKSCRLRWTNYLRPDIKRGKFSDEEERQVIQLHSVLGNKWSAIATHLPGRTDNEIKNYWNTHLRKKLLHMGIDPVTHQPRADLALLASLPTLLTAANLGSLVGPLDNALRLQADAAQFVKIQLVQSLVQILTGGSNTTTTSTSSTASPPTVDALSTTLLNSGFLRNYQSNDLFNLTNNMFQTLAGGGAPGLLPATTTQAPPIDTNVPFNLQQLLASQLPSSFPNTFNVASDNPAATCMPSSSTTASPESTATIDHHMQELNNDGNQNNNCDYLGGLNLEDLTGDFYWMKDILV